MQVDTMTFPPPNLTVSCTVLSLILPGVSSQTHCMPSEHILLILHSSDHTTLDQSASVHSMYFLTNCKRPLMCSLLSAGRFTRLFAVNPASLSRRRIVDADTVSGSSWLAAFLASTAVLRVPRFMLTLRYSTVSVVIFLGRPPLLTGMFSLQPA